MSYVLDPARLSPKQRNYFLNSRAKINLSVGSVRSSKTVMANYRFAVALRKMKDVSGLVTMTGQTLGTLKTNVLLPMQEMFPNHFIFSMGAREAHFAGQQIILRGADDSSSVKKIQGQTQKLAYGDEVAGWNEGYFNMLMSRLSVKGAQFFGTTNPESPYHWLKTNYVDKAPDNPDIKVFNFTVDDNPFLDPGYVETIKRLYSGLWYKRFILGLWVLGEGVVFDMFDEERHVREIKKEWRNQVIGIDYGTTNPTVFGHLGYDDHSEHIHVIREYYYSSRDTGRQKTDAEYCSDLIDFVGNRPIKYVFVDPSASSFKAEVESRTRLEIVDANNDVLDGIRRVARKLSENRLTIDPSCENTIQEFGAYTWDTKASRRGKDQVIKENDHCMDGVLRYPICTLETRDLTPGVDMPVMAL